MYINLEEVLIKRSDLPPIEDHGTYYIVDSIRYPKSDGANHFRDAALRLMAVATRMSDDAAREAAQEAKVWELEHAVPLARTMYNAYHKGSGNYLEDMTEDAWLKAYQKPDYTIQKWVRTASAVLKKLESGNGTN